MDKKIANNMIVGVLVLVGFVAFVFILFNIGGGMLNSQYKLYGKFQQVKGLHMGSEISLSGLRIGTVARITVPESGRDLTVELSIAKEYQERIRKDSVASIRTQGMLGDKYVEITIGSPDQPPLEHGATISTLEPEDIMTKGGNLMEGISRQFQKGGDLENLLHDMSVTARNLAVLTTEMRREKGMIGELIYGNSGVKFNRAMSHFEGILRKIDSGEGSLGALINDPTVYEDIKAMTGGAKRSTVLQYFMKQFIESGSKPQEGSVKK